MDKDKRSRSASLIVVVSMIILIIALSSLVAYLELNRASSESTATTATTYLPFEISVNYSGPWNLVYWKSYNGTISQNNFKGKISGSGNYTTTVKISGTDYIEMGDSGFYSATVTLYGVGGVYNGVAYIQETLCANATKLDSQNLALTLTILGMNKSTIASNRSVELCVSEAV